MEVESGADLGLARVVEIVDLESRSIFGLWSDQRLRNSPRRTRRIGPGEARLTGLCKGQELEEWFEA